VVEGVYQVRGFDLSNITFVEGDTGIIVIDPLISTETARAALQLYRTHRGDRPILAVIYSHSHSDHFGGVFGVTSLAEVQAGAVAIVAPVGGRTDIPRRKAAFPGDRAWGVSRDASARTRGNPGRIA